jgi:surface antigen Omp85-like protein
VRRVLLPALLLAALAWAAAPLRAQAPAAPEPSVPVIKSLVLQGATVVDQKTAERLIGLTASRRLRRDAASAAAALEAAYRIRGFPAARVSGALDPATGTLTLTVDEGRLTNVAVDGVAPDAAERALEVMDLRPGEVLDDRQVARALRELEDRAGGAFETRGDPPYTVERTDDGARLTLHLATRLASAVFSPRGGTGRASLYNRVDGYAPGLRGGLTVFDASSLNHLDLYGHLTYGFAAERASFALGARKPVGPDRLVTFGYEFHDFTDTDDTFRGRLPETPRGRHVFFEIFEDYYRRHGHEAYAFARLGRRAQMGLSFRADDHQSLPLEADGSFLFDKEPPPNPPVAEGGMHSMLVTVRAVGSDVLFADPAAEAESFLVRDPYGTRFARDEEVRAEATFEWADPDALGGDFDFHRLIAHLRGTRVVAPRHVLTGRVLLGLGSEGLPPQRTFSLGGMGTLRGRELREVAGDNAALVTAEYAFEPGSPWPGLTVFYDGGAAWSSDLDGRGWLSDLGIGIVWPGGGRRLGRLDLAIPLNSVTGSRDVRVTGHILLPF